MPPLVLRDFHDCQLANLDRISFPPERSPEFNLFAACDAGSSGHIQTSLLPLWEWETFRILSVCGVRHINCWWRKKQQAYLQYALVRLYKLRGFNAKYLHNVAESWFYKQTRIYFFEKISFWLVYLPLCRDVFFMFAYVQNKLSLFFSGGGKS